MVTALYDSLPDHQAGSEMVLSDKYRPASDTWGITPFVSYCYDVVGHPHRKLVVHPDGSFALHTRPSPTHPSLVLSSGSAGAIYQVDPVTGRPPGAAVRREVERQNPLRQSGVAQAEFIRHFIQADPRERRYLRREEETRSEVARQWSLAVKEFFPGSPIGRNSRPPDSLIEIVRDDVASGPAPEIRPQESRPAPPEPAPEPRKPTRFELIEF